VKYSEEPYLPGSITVKVMNTFPQFSFTVIDERSVTEISNRISVDDNNPSK
jgi:hypothetical protein